MTETHPSSIIKPLDRAFALEAVRVTEAAAIAAYAQANAHTLLELDVNPVLVMPQGQGVLAVDALIHLAGEAHG